MPKVEPRTISRGEIAELKRLQAIYKERLSKLPSGSDRRIMGIYHPKRLDSVV